MREFSNGQKVFIHNFGVGSRWISGVIVNSHGPLTWSIKLEDGKMVILQQIIFEIDMSRTMMKLFKNLKKLKLTTIFNYLTLLSCPIKAILHKKQNQKNQHKTLTIQILPQIKLVKRH